MPELQSSAAYPYGPSGCPCRRCTVLREIPGLPTLGRQVCYRLPSRRSQAPSHSPAQHFPFLSSQPISHLPLPAQAKLQLGKPRAHHLPSLRSPQTLTWPLAGITAPHCLGDSPAAAPPCLCPSKRFCEKRRGRKSKSLPISDAQRMLSLTKPHGMRQAIHKKMNIASQRTGTSLSATQQSEPN